MVGKIETENVDQRALRLWLTAGLAIPEVTALHGDASYPKSNMVAKYTLAADYYRVSIMALAEFERQGIDLRKPWYRSKFYGKTSAFKYEHVVPAKLVRQALIDSDHSPETIRRLLVENSGFVAVLLRQEDSWLRKEGLNAKMPSDWKMGDDPLARYRVVGIELSNEVLRVIGAIMR